MDSYQALLDRINLEIEQLQIPNEPSELYEPFEYTLSLGGKRLRPALVLMAAKLFDGQIDDAIHSALAIEVFHNFTLVHDDIMDDAPIRRGKPSVYKKWGRDVAILSGDVMMIKAYQLLCKNTNHPILSKILEVFNITAVEVCEGQQLDMNFEKMEKVSIPEYMNMITLKTAVLLAGSLKIGALCAGEKEKNADFLYEFGKNIGIAFQLKDDWLDAYAESQKFGKIVGGDIIANKKTYLFLKALELGSQEDKEQLLDFYSDQCELSDEQKVIEVRQIFDRLTVGTYLSDEMNRYFQKGLDYMSEINIPDEKKQPLIELAKKLMGRDT